MDLAPLAYPSKGNKPKSGDIVLSIAKDGSGAGDGDDRKYFRAIVTNPKAANGLMEVEDLDLGARVVTQPTLAKEMNDALMNVSHTIAYLER